MKSTVELASTANRFELLVQSVTDYAIYMLDPRGIVTSWNAGAERFKGYASTEIIGQHFSRFYTEEDRAVGVPEKAMRMAREEGRFEAEGWRLRKDGTRFWASVIIDPIRSPSGDLIGYAKVTRDLTDRKLADEELRRSEERFRLLVQSVTDYAIYMLSPEGHVSSWNAGAERFKGYSADEIMGEHFSRFYREEDREAGVPQAALQTASREGRFEAEGWRVRKDGSQFWASVVIDTVRGANGELIGFAKITRDLTERRRSQLALEQAQKAFFQSQKMEAIGKLTGGVAHDFNNLLAAIVGSVDIARRRLAEGKDIGVFLDNIMHAAQRGATLTQRMLAFARKQDLQLDAVDLTTLVRGMAELLQRTIGPGVTIDTQFPLILKPAQADAAQLELGLLNLAVNARDAMPHGGKIVIAAKQEQVQRGIGLTPGEYVCLSITDNGEGMDEETLAKAIDPFFTTKDVGRGTGLGLSMVAGMMEQCGGKLILRSLKGAGTTAELWLPVANEQRQPSTPEFIGTKNMHDVKPLTILAVDDERIVLANTAAMLSDLGHTVLQASSGHDALQVLAKHEIDLLLTDLAMPGMSGGELVKAAAAGWPDLPIVIISGYVELPGGAALGLPRLAKPFTQEQIATAITSLFCNKGKGQVLSFPNRRPSLKP